MRQLATWTSEHALPVLADEAAAPTDEPIDREEPFGPFKLWNLEKPAR